MIKQKLNFQKLKKGSEKDREVYKKAVAMLNEGWQTEQLSKEEIMEMASRYPQLKVRVLVGGDILVESIMDVWMIHDEHNFISLYHQGFTYEGFKMREKYHIQDVFYDLDFVFASIVSHDEFKKEGIRRTSVGIMEIVQDSFELASV